MLGLLTNGSRRFSIYSAITAMTLGLLAACGGGDDDTTTTTPTVPVVPTEVPTAPQSVTAVATPAATKSVTLTWSEPASGLPVVSYNLYRSITPNVAADLTAAQKIAGVTSPYVDVVPSGDVPYYYVVTAVNVVGEGAASAEVTATPPGDRTFGNNLSVPLVFANGVGVTGDVIGAVDSDYLDRTTGLRPTLTDVTDPFPYLNPADIIRVGQTDYYPQKTSSSWQASWKNSGAESNLSVVVDWGDNLRSASLAADQSIIRVETNLLQNKGTLAWPDTESMQAFPMRLLAGQGITELQGTTGIPEEATQRRVFTINARMKIEKLDGPGGTPVASPCSYEGTIVEGFSKADNDQTKYSTEINVGGAITYGFNWRLGTCSADVADKQGVWRLTFSLDPTVTHDTLVYTNNVSLDEIDPTDQGAAVLNSSTSTSIEIQIN
jgi:hypothetical protein